MAPSLTRLVSALLVVGVAGCTRAPAPAPAPTVVQTSSGVVAGTVLESGVKAWLGVPYAQAPVRELRWKEAQPITWTGTYNADRKMSACIQILRPHNINHYFGEEPTSEDCLYMNIWAPPDATRESRLPVVVFIYGGGGTVGSSGMANYDGAQVARRGAIYVNFNYRLGILGFMAHPELTKEQGGHSGNYGYLDQSAALKWIQQNIAAFGGDPAKVIISGQSAGAGSVAQQIFSPRSQGLFRGAVMFSACNFTSSNTPLAEGEATGLEIQKALEAASLDDMRQVPADRILSIQNEFQLGRSVPGIRTSGVIDGYFMPDTKAAILAAGGAADVPDHRELHARRSQQPAQVGDHGRGVQGKGCRGVRPRRARVPRAVSGRQRRRGQGRGAGGGQRRGGPVQLACMRDAQGAVPQVADLHDGVLAQAPVRARREDRRPGHGDHRGLSHV